MNNLTRVGPKSILLLVYGGCVTTCKLSHERVFEFLNTMYVPMYYGIDFDLVRVNFVTMSRLYWLSVGPTICEV